MDNFYNFHAVIHPTYSLGYLIPQTNFCTRRLHYRLAFLYPIGCCKKRWELVWFWFFTMISTHNFCNSHAVISETCNRGYLIPQTDFWTVALTTPPCWSIQQGTTKKQWELVGFDIFTLIFTHHFYNSHAGIPKICDWGYLIISSHRPIFDLMLTLPPFWWHQKVAALQKESREWIKERLIHFFHSQFLPFYWHGCPQPTTVVLCCTLFYVINQF